MALEVGTRLGAYEVAARLGAGGMGEVYRARDTKLDRDVALKVLPEAFTADPDRLARFQREAKVLASLNHPHIGHIYGLEETDGQKALVLELVEGPTLADRIAQGPIPLDEALPIARQIAEALEAAHEQGIIHRDLKPANVKVKPDETVKVLDFGLAKALEPEREDPDASQSPTLTARATHAGVILGTAAYMAPEQARGKPVDKRADIWAFGAVLYEMLTGVRPFQGEDVAKTLARILEREPDWSLVPGSTPAGLCRLLERCLDKNPRTRLRDVGEARVVLEGGEDDFAGGAGPTRSGQVRRLVAVAAVVVLAALGASAVTYLAVGTRGAVPGPTTRWTLSPPPGRVFQPERFFQSLTFSPDGRQLVFTATPGGEELAIEGGPQLFVRDLSSLEMRPLPGSEATTGLGTGATNAFFSPDGRWLGFTADRSLKRISVEGGAPITICEECPVYGYGQVWLPDDTIVLGDAQRGVGLQRVPAGGGPATPLTTLEEGEIYHRWPSRLPDGRHLLFTVVDDQGERLEVVDVETGRRRGIQGITRAARPRYLQSGHLLYTYGRELWAAPFDLRTLTVGAGAIRIHDFGFYSPVSTLFAVSQGGTLAYMTGSGEPRRRLVWVDRDGERTDFGAEPEYFWNPRLSPDGKRLAVDVSRSGELDVWIYDIASGRRERLTSDGRSCYPHWMPDGRIGFAVRTGWHPEPLWGVLTARGASGVSRAAETLLSYPYGAPGSWSGGGQLLFEIWGDDESGFDLWSLGPDGTAQPWLETEYHESQPEVSPDGRWLAYSSTETGEWEVFVASFPDGERKVRVSSRGGLAPVWSADGRELFYREGASVMRVPWTGHPGSSVQPTRLSADRYWLGTVTHMERNYDVAPDGRFLMLEPVDEGPVEPAKIVVVQNWLEELKRLVPVD